jgi:predicted MPP superfamily phosphohydrolase
MPSRRFLNWAATVPGHDSTSGESHLEAVVPGAAGLAASVLAATAALGAYAAYWEPHHPVLRRARVNVPTSWPRIDILHVSDLHAVQERGRLRSIQRRLLRGLTPDILCLTGDGCERAVDVPGLVEILEAARPRLGAFAILGNHEYDASDHLRGWRRTLVGTLSPLRSRGRSSGPAEADEIAARLRSAGLTVLRNAGQRLVVDGRALWVAGCDSAWAGRHDVAAAMAGRRDDEPCLGLIHEPTVAFEGAAAGMELILAGHTHGGQVRLPGLGALITNAGDDRLKSARGLQQVGDAVLHITTGLGQATALRFGCRPEAVWLQCEPRPAVADRADRSRRAYQSSRA